MKYMENVFPGCKSGNLFYGSASRNQSPEGKKAFQNFMFPSWKEQLNICLFCEDFCHQIKFESLFL